MGDYKVIKVFGSNLMLDLDKSSFEYSESDLRTTEYSRSEIDLILNFISECSNSNISLMKGFFELVVSLKSNKFLIYFVLKRGILTKNDIAWVKENIELGIDPEFIEGYRTKSVSLYYLFHPFINKDFKELYINGSPIPIPKDINFSKVGLINPTLDNLFFSFKISESFIIQDVKSIVIIDLNNNKLEFNICDFTILGFFTIDLIKFEKIFNVAICDVDFNTSCSLIKIYNGYSYSYFYNPNKSNKRCLLQQNTTLFSNLIRYLKYYSSSLVFNENLNVINNFLKDSGWIFIL